MQCRICGKEFLGAVCPSCGTSAVANDAHTLRRRRREMRRRRPSVLRGLVKIILWILFGLACLFFVVFIIDMVANASAISRPFLYSVLSFLKKIAPDPLYLLYADLRAALLTVWNALTAFVGRL